MICKYPLGNVACDLTLQYLLMREKPFGPCWSISLKNFLCGLLSLMLQPGSLFSPCNETNEIIFCNLFIPLPKRGKKFTYHNGKVSISNAPYLHKTLRKPSGLSFISLQCQYHFSRECLFPPCFLTDSIRSASDYCTTCLLHTHDWKSYRMP